MSFSEYVTSSCGVPPTVVNAYVEIVNISTVTYHCREGFVANQSSNTRHCLSGQWEALSLGCIGNAGQPHGIRSTCNIKLKFGHLLKSLEAKKKKPKKKTRKLRVEYTSNYFSNIISFT